jgi:hypothetical protein
MESPARITDASTTCSALYLASGDVTSHRACRVVFESESSSVLSAMRATRSTPMSGATSAAP